MRHEYFFFMVWFGTNVLTALVIDVFVAAAERKAKAEAAHSALSQRLAERRAHEFATRGGRSSVSSGSV